jgi:hypothetical protein
MKPVWDRIDFRDLTGRDKALGDGMLQMFCDLGPFKTFGTITVEPRHDKCSVAAPTMEKIVLKTFSRRRFKGMKFGWFIEANKQRPGTHAHFVTRDEPAALRWSGPDSVGEFMIERYGRFRTEGVDGKKTFGLAAYLAKYCSKELADSHWGFKGWIEHLITDQEVGRPKLRGMKDKDPAPIQDPEEVQALRETAKAWNWQKSAGREIRQHSQSRENGRTNVRTSYDSKEEIFKQEIVYNNLK